MTTVPLDPPSQRELDAKFHAYVKARFDEYDRANVALAKLIGAYHSFGLALNEAAAAVGNTKAYNPEEWFEFPRALTPADLRVPSRTQQFLVHDPEEFLEADVMLRAMQTAMRRLAEQVEQDVVAAARVLREADEEGAA